MPEARRTPKASLIVTIKKQKAKMKVSLETPDLKATHVVRVVTRAVWLEGKPPVRQTRLSDKALSEWIFPEKSPIIVFMNWAVNQLNKHAWKTGFVIMSAKTFFPKCILI